MLDKAQVEALRDDGAVLITHVGWYESEQWNSRVDLVNVLAARGAALPFIFTDEEALASYRERRRQWVNEAMAVDDTKGSGQRVPTSWTEREPAPLFGFYCTTDQGKAAVMRVHPDDRVSYAWTMGQQAADAVLERGHVRRTYTREYAHHE
jgi:hypothetical protein